MKLISWNVNGLRACLGKGFLESFAALDADIFSIQETKMQPGQAELDLPGYKQYWNSAEKKGYSGTAVFTRLEPLNVTYGIGSEEHDREGRAITLEFEDFYLVNCYVPNAQRELTRLDWRMEWEDALREYLLGLDSRKPVIYCGDLNVAHQEIDLKNAKSNRGNAGFTDEERSKLTELLEAGFVDSFRHLYPDKTGPTPGGATCSTPGRRTRGGASTIFLSPSPLRTKSATALSIPRLWAATTARWSWTFFKNFEKGVRRLFRGGLQAAARIIRPQNGRIPHLRPEMCFSDAHVAGKTDFTLFCCLRAAKLCRGLLYRPEVALFLRQVLLRQTKTPCCGNHSRAFCVLFPGK